MNNNLSPLNGLDEIIRRRIKRAATAKQNRKLIFDTVRMVAILAIAAIIFFVFFGFKIVDGNGMYPALHDGDLTLVWHKSKYIKGDIVFYKVNGTVYCGRVVAKGGDRIRFTKDGKLYVNGSEQAFDIVFSAYSDDGENEIIVPENSVYILGDCYTDCTDSRTLGTISLNDVTAKVISIVRHKKL